MATASPIPACLNPELLNEQQAGAYIGISPGTLSVWRSVNRYGIPYIKVGHRVRYRKSDLDAWLESRTVIPPEVATL